MKSTLFSWIRRFTNVRGAVTICSLILSSPIACSHPLAVESDILTARVVRHQLELTNYGTEPVYYFAVDRNSLAVIDWAVCIDPQSCQSVPQRSVTRIPLTEVALFGEGDTEIVVFHWRLVPGQSETGFVADSLRTLSLRVK